MINLKNLSKRGLALCLSVLMCMGMLNLTVLAADDSPYACGLEEHIHTDECYEIVQVSGEPVCGQETGEGAHEHSEECYALELTCALEESEGHSHGDDCYTTETETVETVVLTCTLEETAGHSHSDSCWTTTSEEVLVCTDESEDHEHDSSCYVTETSSELTCTLEESDGHSHGDDCYTTETETVETVVLTCETEESEGHSHGDDCYSSQLACGLEETEGHEHSEACYATETMQVLVCGKEEHIHTVECCGVYAGLTDALQALGDKFGAFQEEYFDSLDGDTDMDAFAAAAAEQFGEEFNAVLALYQQIPGEVACGAAYAELTDALEMLASAMGGDLDAGVQPLALGAIFCDSTDISNQTYFARSDGNHTITVNGTWYGTLEFGGPYTVTIKGNGTINANNNGSAIIVKDGCTVILEGNVTITGGTGTLIKRTSAASENNPAKWSVGSQTGVVDTDSLNGYASIIGGSRTDVTCGGGILLTGTSKLIMNGGTITGNKAAMGGGICSFRGAVVEIYGGSITSNTASTYAGGGMFLGAENNVIDPTTDIWITNNTTNTEKDLGGGGIFVDSAGSLKVVNAVIAGNMAGGLGGGVAGCLHGMVSNLSPDTAAIYNNKSSVTANGTKQATHTLNNLVDHDEPRLEWNNSLETNAKDYFVAGFSNIGSLSLGGGSAVWSGEAVLRSGGVSNVTNGSVSTSTQDPLIVQGLLGLTVTNAEDVAAKVGNVTAAKVYIQNNYSNMHGGGIGTNGLLTFGEMNYSYSSSKITIEASKTVATTDSSGATTTAPGSGYTFQLWMGSTLLGTATSDSNGKITFPNLSTAILFGNATAAGTVTASLTLKEIPGSTTGMTYDTTVRTINLTATREVTDSKTATTHGGGNHVSVSTFSDTLKSVNVSQGSATISGSTVTLQDAANFTNKMEYGSLTVSKTVSNHEVDNLDAQFTFTVKLGNGTASASGTEYVANGVYTIYLKHGKSFTINNIPVGVKYTVTEADAGGYKYLNGQVTTQKAIIAGSNSVAITNERDVKSLTVKKTVTVNEPSSEAPNKNDEFTIKVTLGDGSDTTDRGNATTYAGLGVYTFTLKDGDTATIQGIPTDTKYLVSEGEIPEYEYVNTNKLELDNRADLTTDTTVEVINHYYKPKYTSVTVEKTWNGGEDYMPKSITVQLMRDGEPCPGESAVMIHGYEGEFTHTWDKLPAYSGDSADATQYTYTVKEVSVNYAADSKYTADAREGNIIRVRSDVEAEDGSGNEIVGGWIVNDQSGSALSNTWRGATELGDTSFTVHKVDSETGDAIQGVTFTLTKDGEPVDEQTTNADGLATFSALTDGTYTLTETEAAEGYRIEDGVNVGRTWEIKIVKDGLASVKEVDEDNSLGENTWNWKPVDTDGSMALNGENHTGTLTIGNDIIKGNISITKVLDLDGVTGDFTGEPAEKEFEFTVYAEEVFGVPEGTVAGKLSPKAGETQTLEALRYGTYLIVETGDTDLTDYDFTGMTVSGATPFTKDGQNAWRVQVTEEGTTFEVTATNHYERHVGGLSVSKTVSRGDTNRDWHFTVALTAPADYVKLGDAYDVTILTPAVAEDGTAVYEETAGSLAFNSETGLYEGITLKHGQIAVVTGIPVGTSYEVVEVEANESPYQTSMTGETGTVDQETDSTAAFTNWIPNEFSEPITINITVSKVWVGDSEETRPDSITAVLYRNGQSYSSVELSESNSWSGVWTGLPASYTWTVGEATVPAGYTSEVTSDGNSFTITNTWEETPEDRTSEEETPEEETPEDGTPEEEPSDEVDIQDEDTPLAAFPDEQVPLADLVDDPLEIFDDIVPLAEMPDEEVPLAAVPATGDNSRTGLWATLCGLSLLGIIALLGKKRKDKEA